MKYLHLILSLAFVGIVWAGCASSPVKRTEENLTRFGFKTVVATNASQKKLMHTLPANRISHVMRKGKDYYVFPDHSRDLLFVGNSTQFQNYKTYLSDQQLAADAQMARDVYEAPRLSRDVGINTDGEYGWEQAWYGWDSQDAY